MSEINFDECSCSCHNSYFEVDHITACCVPCFICKNNIRFNIENHLIQCKSEHIKFLEERLLRPLTEEEKELLFK